jgi:putative ubiquitin-RnfH superfamily antitoxin RatB of RatAB toxin-antitoxin module
VALKVEVVYALPRREKTVSVMLADGATVADALSKSGLQFDPARVGIFGEPATAETRLADGDRVEVYRPLKIDPKEARRRRVKR